MRAHTESGNNKHEYFLPIENRISVWPIESFRSLKLGRAARLMMEISDPRVALAISEHANFTFDRLERTNKGNTEIIFGDKETSLRRAKIVNQAHQVNSTDVTGKKYTANDPKLKGFVFDMRTMAVIINHENFVRKLSVREKDAYVRGIKSYGLVMGVPERDSANTWSEVVDRYNRRLREGVIEVSTDALSVVSC